MPHGRRQRRGNSPSHQALEGLEERAGSPRTHSLPWSIALLLPSTAGSMEAGRCWVK